MKMKSYLPPLFLFLLASVVGIQAQGTISDALATDGKLSTLRSILNNNPALTQLLDDKSYGQRTFLAPSNTALANYTANFTSSGNTQTLMEAILSYHIMNGSFPASNLTSPGGVAAATFLQNSQYTNLGNGSSGNVVYASQYGSSGESSSGKLEVFGGVGNSAPIVTTDIKYGNGYVHIVDNLLPLPQTCTGSMGKLSLSSLLVALNNAALAQTLDNTAHVTCFAPTQDAFTAAGDPENKLPKPQLADALLFHTLGKAMYSPDLKTGASYQTLSNQSIKVVRDGGALYLEGDGGGKAKVVMGNVIVKNGVMHVIDQLLVPANKTNGTTTSSSSPSSTSSGGSRGATTSPTGKNSGNRIVPSTALLFAIIAVIFSGLF